MVDEDKTDCIDYGEADWYYECAHKEHGWTIPLEKGYKDNNFDQDKPKCLNYNEFEWMINKFGGLKEAPACKIIPADRSPIEDECPAVSYNMDEVMRRHDLNGDKCMDFYEYKWFYGCNRDAHKWDHGTQLWKWVKRWDTNGKPDCCLDRSEVERTIGSNEFRGFKQRP